MHGVTIIIDTLCCCCTNKEIIRFGADRWKEITWYLVRTLSRKIEQKDGMRDGSRLEGRFDKDGRPPLRVYASDRQAAHIYTACLQHVRPHVELLLLAFELIPIDTSINNTRKAIVCWPLVGWIAC